MTKKPSEKNRAWEKDRRDRLNKAFEQLAELLPQYDPTVNWSKNEIIQKSIGHIKNIQEEKRNLLTQGDADSLNLYDELISCIKFLQARNKQLADLLTKAKITIPAIKLPNFLIENPKISVENNFNNINIHTIGRPKKYTSKITIEEAKEIAKNKENISSTEISVPDEVPSKGKESIPAAAVVTHDNNSKVCNSETITTKCNSTVSVTTTSSTGVVTTGRLIPVVPLTASLVQTSLPPLTPLFPKAPVIDSNCVQGARKLKIFNIQTLQKSVKFARDKNGKIKILPRPGVKLQIRKLEGKFPTFKKRKKVGSTKTNVSPQKKRKICVENGVADKENVTKEIQPSESVQSLNKNRDCKNEDKAIESRNPSTQVESKGNTHLNIEKCKKQSEPSTDTIQGLHENTLEKHIDQPSLLSTSDLPNDYFATLHIPQNEPISECVSPTAAFLLSFPVVHTSSGKNQETSDDGAVSSNTIPGPTLNTKNDGPSEEITHVNNPVSTDELRKENTTTADNFDTLNTFFTTKEYHQFIARNNGIKANESKSQGDTIMNDIVRNCETTTIPASETNITTTSRSVPSTIQATLVTASSAYVNTTNLSSNGSEKVQSQLPNTSVTTCGSYNSTICSSTPTSTSMSVNSNKVSEAQALNTILKSDIPWTTHSTSEYKSTFTFSLTPTTSSYSNTTKLPCDTNSLTNNKTFNTLPLPIPSETVTKSTFDYFEYPKIYNPPNNKNMLPMTTSYTSLNFTFSLTNPKSSITTVSNTKSTSTECLQPNLLAGDTYKYQNYPTYGLNTQTQARSKDCTSFTFALTPSTKSTSTTFCGAAAFSIDNTLGVDATTSSTNIKKAPIVSSYAGDCVKVGEKHSNMSRATCKNVPNKDGNFQNTNKQPIYSCQNQTQKPSKNHVNWMTSSETNIPIINYSTVQNNSTYYTPHIPANPDGTKKSEMFYASTATEENFPPWSPSKILDTTHAPVQGNYYSDVGFNNTSFSSTNTFNNSSKMYANENNVTKSCKQINPNPNNPSNFFSVSQLVDQGNGNSKNYGSCAKKSGSSSKSKEVRRASEKPFDQKASCRPQVDQNNFATQDLYQDPQKPIQSSAYSAEALLSKKEKHKNFSQGNGMDFYNVADTTMNVYSTPTDNVEPNSYNTNYFYNYGTTQNCAQQSDYIGTFCNDIQYTKNTKTVYSHHGNTKNPAIQRTKDKNQINTNLPPVSNVSASGNMMSYDSNYFPVPLAVNPPLITPGGSNETYEPHHTYPHTNFQHNAWNAKNTFPTYHHGHFQQSLAMSEQIPPNVNPANSSGNLTNFNLSTICPEINDRSRQNTGHGRNISGNQSTNLHVYH